MKDLFTELGEATATVMKSLIAERDALVKERDELVKERDRLRRLFEDPRAVEAAYDAMTKVCLQGHTKGEARIVLRAAVESIQAVVGTPGPCAHAEVYADREYGTTFCRACHAEVKS